MRPNKAVSMPNPTSRAITTAHSAIVARALGIPAVVGAGDAVLRAAPPPPSGVQALQRIVDPRRELAHIGFRFALVDRHRAAPPRIGDEVAPEADRRAPAVGLDILA